MSHGKRIAKNTLLLYFRMILKLFISLYTSRVILDVLGVEDFGIYNVVGGMVGMFTILSGSLSAAVSRFITFELGKGNKEKLQKIFSTSVFIHIGLGVLILIIAETAGVWFLKHKMTIPEARLDAAFWVLQFSILTFVMNLLSIPYNATIIAHEHMKAFAYVGILEVILKLGFVLSLYLIPFDKLILHAGLLCLLAITVRLIYTVYCRKHFEECKLTLKFEVVLVKEMTSFAGWNFIGASSAILRNQGVNLLLNIFHGPAMNAARGIAFQVNSAISGFVTNFMTAINPQITKSYAQGDFKYAQNLAFQGARFSFYLLLIFSLPILICTEDILDLWLKEVPSHTVLFVRLVLLFAMSESLSGTLVTIMLATGDIRKYQIIVGGLQLMNFPVSYILLKLGVFPEVTMLVAIVFSQLCLIARLYLLKGMVGLSIGIYLKTVYLNISSVTLVGSIFPILFSFIVPIGGIYKVLLTCIIAFLMVVSSIFLVGCNKEEKKFIKTKVSEQLVKLKSK